MISTLESALVSIHPPYLGLFIISRTFLQIYGGGIQSGVFTLAARETRTHSAAVVEIPCGLNHLQTPSMTRENFRKPRPIILFLLERQCIVETTCQ